MDTRRFVQVRLAGLVRGHDPAGEFSWPPVDDAAGADAVVDMDSRQIVSLPQAAAAAADQPSETTGISPWAAPAQPAADALISPRSPAIAAPPAQPWPDVADEAPRRPLTVWVIGGLALLVIIQSAVIGLQLTRRETAPAALRAPLPLVEARPEGGAPAATARAPAPPQVAVRTVGELAVRSVPAGASVFVNGTRRGMAPLTLGELSAGSHRVRVVSGANSVDQTVTVDPGARISLVVPMPGVPRAAGMTAGWLDIATHVPVDLREDGQLLGTSAQRRLQLQAGEHRLELVNEALGYRVVENVTVKPSETTILRPAIPEGSLHVNAVPWAEVFVDGRRVGDTPLGNLRVPLGMREVRFRHPDFGEQTRRIIVTAREPARVTVDLRP